MDKVAASLAGCLAIIALVGMWLLGVAFLLMVVWNALLPYLVSAPALSYGQSVAMVIFITIVGGAFKSVTYNNK